MAAREEKSDRKTRTKVTTSHDSKEVYRRISPRLQTQPLRGELEKLCDTGKAKRRIGDYLGHCPWLTLGLLRFVANAVKQEGAKWGAPWRCRVTVDVAPGSKHREVGH